MNLLQSNWASLPEFLAMGGYGVYVWGAFGMTALVMAIEMASLAARRKAARDRADESTALNEESYP
jgi:heme exporter protein D